MSDKIGRRSLLNESGAKAADAGTTPAVSPAARTPLGTSGAHSKTALSKRNRLGQDRDITGQAGTIKQTKRFYRPHLRLSIPEFSIPAVCLSSAIRPSRPSTKSGTDCGAPSSAKNSGPNPWTKELWVYDLRTNKHFTQKQRPITRADFDEFVGCFQPGALHQRRETWSEANPDGRWRLYRYEDILKRDKLSLDLFWIKDRSLTDTDALPPPDILAAGIADELQAAFELFSKISAKLPKSTVSANA